MKKIIALVATVCSLGLGTAFAQLGMGPQYDGAMNKLFGDNRTFTARMEIQSSTGDSNTISTPGQLSFDHGKSRFEMNMGDVQGSIISPEAIQQMKAMGMDLTIFISRPDLKVSYIIYPGLKSYLQVAAKDTSGNANPDDYKLEVTADGKETLDGHDCARTKATVSDKDGNKHEFTVWNATDLKNFPVKIATADGGHPTTMVYKNVSFAAPDASLFDPPADYTKYDNQQAMMQAIMMKKFGGAAGGPPPGQ